MERVEISEQRFGISITEYPKFKLIDAGEGIFAIEQESSVNVNNVEALSAKTLAVGLAQIKRQEREITDVILVSRRDEYHSQGGAETMGAVVLTEDKKE